MASQDVDFNSQEYGCTQVHRARGTRPMCARATLS